MPVTHPTSRREFEEIGDLTGRVFGGYFPFRDWMRRWQAHPNNRPELTRILKIDGQIISHVLIVDVPVRYGDATLRIGGIGCVETHGDHTKKGYSSQVMEDVVRFMEADGFDLSLLFGIRNFYHKFGYRTARVRENLSLTTNEIEVSDTPDLREKKLRRKDIPKIAALFDRMTSDYPLAPIRDESIWNWHWRFEHLDLPLGIWEGDNLVGYACMGGASGREVIVEDRLEAYEAMLGLLKRHGQKNLCPSIEVNCPSDGGFARYIFYNKRASMSRSTDVNGGPMMRMCNMGSLIDQDRA